MTDFGPEKAAKICHFPHFESDRTANAYIHWQFCRFRGCDSDLVRKNSAVICRLLTRRANNFYIRQRVILRCSADAARAAKMTDFDARKPFKICHLQKPHARHAGGLKSG